MHLLDMLQKVKSADFFNLPRSWFLRLHFVVILINNVMYFLSTFCTSLLSASICSKVIVRESSSSCVLVNMFEFQ